MEEKNKEKVYMGKIVGYCYSRGLCWTDIEKVIELVNFLIWKKHNDTRRA